MADHPADPPEPLPCCVLPWRPRPELLSAALLASQAPQSISQFSPSARCALARSFDTRVTA